MKLINILPATMLCAALLNTNQASAQTWNVTGNAGTATTNYLGTSDAKDLKIKTNNQTRMFVKSSGQVGIGTTTPAALLHVQKSTLSEVLIKSTGAGSQLTIDRAGNGWDAVTRYTQTGVPQWKTGLTVNGTGSPDYVIRNEITNGDALSISGSNNYVNLPAGYLTLGTTNPSTLSLSGNDLNVSTYSPNIFSGFTAGNIIMATSFGTFKSGKVGIGTNDPSRAKLVVQGAVGSTNAIFGHGSSGISLVQNWPSVGFNSYFGASGWKSMQSGYGFQMSFDPSAGHLTFFTSNSATAADESVTQTVPMIIHANGSVGINYSGAASVLDVNLKPGISTTASFWGSNSGFGSHFCNGGNENTYIRGGQTASNVIIADVGTQLVGIGTANPAYKLDVCGTMRAKEVRVATGWCDYVFAEDYKLPALSDVESFIKENKHLPEVTPGAIESEGLEIGKTSAQMIKKIEELTLYVIDLQKQVNELKKSDK